MSAHRRTESGKGALRKAAAARSGAGVTVPEQAAAGDRGTGQGDQGPLLDIRDLRVQVGSGDRALQAVSGVNLSVAPGEMVAVVGETGSGKSMTALSVLRLLRDPVRISGGQILFEGEDLVAMPERRLRKVRGARIGMVFQDPMTALNPFHRIGDQIVEMICTATGERRRAVRPRVPELLAEVGITRPELRVRQYPHELSGGMRQRAMIAMALANRPRLLIADEPTTGLDATVEAQVLALLRELNRQYGMAVMIITHNLGVVAGLSDRTVVMYGGRVVESGPTAALFADPRHPYTRALLDAVPSRGRAKQRLATIPGLPPDLREMPTGCAFHPRCPMATDRCVTELPALSHPAPGRESRCHFADRPIPPGRPEQAAAADSARSAADGARSAADSGSSTSTLRVSRGVSA